MKITDLTERLKQETSATEERIKRIENEALSTFETDLKQRCSTAANILKSGLDDVESEFQNSLKVLNRDVKAWAPSLLKVVKWAIIAPVVLTLALCLVAIGASLLWWKIENRERVHMTPFIAASGQRMMRVDEPTWDYCQGQTITVNGKKIETREPCRKAE